MEVEDDHHSQAHPRGHGASLYRPSDGPLSSAEDWDWHRSKRSISSSLQRARGVSDLDRPLALSLPWPKTRRRGSNSGQFLHWGGGREFGKSQNGLIFFRSGDTNAPIGGAVDRAQVKTLEHHSTVCVP